jgi:ABC-type antimicrobial peptide transport system permease subunit
MLQFLVETVTLSVIGGLLGVGLGVAGTVVLRHATQWNAVVTADAILLSMGVSCVTGVLFGLYPASRAAKMDPVTALRLE